jgi:SAM-dependent methyltransferase
VLAADSPARRVLDIGAGTGDLAERIRASMPETEIAGLDVSSEGLEIARQKVPDALFLVRDLMGAETAPPELRAWATHAVCSEVLEHVDEPERLLSNAVQYLAPGCLLVVTVPGGPLSAFDRHIGHRRHYRPFELRGVLEGAGFEVEQTTGAGFPFFNLYRLVVLLRGRQLIADVGGGEATAFARLVMRVFGALFRLNLARSRWGWQTIARARLPR